MRGLDYLYTSFSAHRSVSVFYTYSSSTSVFFLYHMSRDYHSPPMLSTYCGYLPSYISHCDMITYSAYRYIYKILGITAIMLCGHVHTLTT